MLQSNCFFSILSNKSTYLFVISFDSRSVVVCSPKMSIVAFNLLSFIFLIAFNAREVFVPAMYLFANNLIINFGVIFDVIAHRAESKQEVKLKQGIDKDNATKINKLIKSQKIKVQSQIQGDQLRVTGKKIDDFQKIIQIIKEEKISLPLQFINMRS